MNKHMLAAAALAFAFAGPVIAAETIGEKAQATAHDAKRGAKKAVNRAKEAVCMEGDLKCAAKKAANRAEEAKDATVDKAKEVKNSVD
ncbi:MAG: hypothetical protein KF802_07390 [Bdellovibrionaceae bacterium]|nr:hypothetical protein [Pseudobdellovibrionaceae bacterium]MBX3033005.1 hypothetical protein [Pseudobdellovibrionaceae bacterium]